MQPHEVHAPPPSAPSDVGKLYIWSELEIEPDNNGQKAQDAPVQEGSYLSRSSHPIAAIFHILFKILAFVQ